MSDEFKAGLIASIGFNVGFITMAIIVKFII